MAVFLCPHICAHDPQQVNANTTAFFSNSYIQETMQASSGLTEACIGSGIFVGTGGLGSVPGAMITAHGLDNYIAGMNSLMTSKHTDNSNIPAGMSPQSASVMDGKYEYGGQHGWYVIRSSQVFKCL